MYQAIAEDGLIQNPATDFRHAVLNCDAALSFIHWYLQDHLDKLGLAFDSTTCVCSGRACQSIITVTTRVGLYSPVLYLHINKADYEHPNMYLTRFQVIDNRGKEWELMPLEGEGEKSDSWLQALKDDPKFFRSWFDDLVTTWTTDGVPDEVSEDSED